MLKGNTLFTLILIWMVSAQVCFTYLFDFKTSIKDVHENESQGRHKVRRLYSKKWNFTKTFHKITELSYVTFNDL